MTAWENQTFNSEFILLGIFDHSPTHIFLLSLVLHIFTEAQMGNSTMILLIYLDTQLHTPMYFLLSQLSLMAFNYLSGRTTISLTGCATQIFFYASLLSCECFLLTVTAYDHYVAICHPLRYPKICGLMVASSWILGSSDGVTDAAETFSFSYCGFWEIAHFFCDFPSLLSHACNDTSIFEMVLFIFCIVMIVIPVIIIVSYTRVLLAVIRMGSGEGRHKAFTTCSSHLRVVGMYYGTVLFAYIWPTSDRSPTQDKMVSIFYTIFTPMLNPLIYSLQNKEVTRAFMKILGKGRSGE
ncbi:LOW QUALITY PROTEIN: olfactory receptor 2M3-like [Trichechus inunguis]